MARGVPPWYHGKISADEATKILVKFGQPNAFLLRDSQYSEATFTLSVTGPQQDRDGNFNIQHYRIIKNTNKRSQWNVLSFPSRDDLQNCMRRQAPKESKSRLKLVTAVDKHVIEKWDSTENNWRDRITVYDTDRDVKKDEPAKPKKSPKKRTGMFKRISKLFSPSDDHTADKDDHIYESIDHQDGIDGSDKQSGPASQCSNYETVNDHNYYQPVSSSQDDCTTAHDRKHGQPVSTSNEGYATVDDHNYLQPASNLRERCVTVHDSIHIQGVPTSRDGYATVEDPQYREPTSDLKDGHATVNDSENMQTVHFSNDSHVTRNDSSHLQPLPTSTEGYATLEDPRYSQPASDSRDDFVTVDGSDLIQPVTTSIDGGYAILEDPRYVQARSNLKDRHATVDESTPMQPENNYEHTDEVNEMSARNPHYHRKESLQEKDKDESYEYASPMALGQYKTANNDENAIYQSPTSNKKLLNGKGTQVDNPEYMNKIDAQLF